MLSVDLETYCELDLTKCGVYKYASHPSFEILLFAYAYDDKPVQIVDLASGEELPSKVYHDLIDECVTKTAYNANFERVCLSAYLGRQLTADQWQCTMVQSALLGLPMSLEGVGAVVGLEQQKMSEGKSLIRYFSKPCSPTKINGGRTRNLPHHTPDKWQQFKDYCVRDVEVERAIRERLHKFPIPPQIQSEYELDQKINDRGIMVDLELVRNAIECDEQLKIRLNNKMREITGLNNPNSVIQMKNWLVTHGLEIETLGKKDVAEKLKTAPPLLKEVLELRQQSSKTSVKKYTAIETAVCDDNRLHGMFQFYGANRTGRFAGRLVQLHNLAVNKIDNLEEMRMAVKNKNYDNIDTFILSELIRTAFVPQKGKKFIVADFSAIEARVLSWLAKEKWRNNVFATHGKIYEASASQMFGVPIEEVTKGSPLRQKGKIAELALGYGGSIGALKAMGALEMGLTEDELQPLVDSWRQANPNIVKYWYEVEKAVFDCITNRTPSYLDNLVFDYRSGILFIGLPSGRKLAYCKPRIEQNKFDRPCVTYEGITTGKNWGRIESYGAKFVENIVQAVSRDILCFALQNLSQYKIVGHIHDEIILEVDNSMKLETVLATMRTPPPWASDLKLDAAGFESEFYKKD